jgi:hypothetical protein
MMSPSIYTTMMRSYHPFPPEITDLIVSFLDIDTRLLLGVPPKRLKIPSSLISLMNNRTINTKTSKTHNGIQIILKFSTTRSYNRDGRRCNNICYFTCGDIVVYEGTHYLSGDGMCVPIWTNSVTKERLDYILTRMRTKSSC